MRLRTIAIMIFAGTACGCVHTRDPMPVPMRNANDMALACEEIRMEYLSNTEIAIAKIAKNQSNDTNDAVLGCLIWPGLADFKNADGVEGNALLDRNVCLKNLAFEKGCDTSKYPVQPKRYE